MKWLLDTNIISELRKPHPNDSVLIWYRTINVGQMYTSSLNIAELVYGAEMQKDLIKRRELLRWIDEDVRKLMAGRTQESKKNKAPQPTCSSRQSHWSMGSKLLRVMYFPS
jgi:predicted nucleic acid-binding protein